MAHKTTNNSNSNTIPAGEPSGLSGVSGVFGRGSNAQARAGKFHQPASQRGRHTPKNPAANWRRFNP